MPPLASFAMAEQDTLIGLGPADYLSNTSGEIWQRRPLLAAVKKTTRLTTIARGLLNAGHIQRAGKQQKILRPGSTGILILPGMESLQRRTLRVPTIVTLSSIPSRFRLIGPTLASLLSQSLQPQEIRLYIPEKYRRFPDWDGTLPEVPSGIAIHRCEYDYGPATKILPAARDMSGKDVDILFCDDDKIYDRNWHARFKSQAAARPGTCIVEVGESFPDIADSHRPADRLPRGRKKRKGFVYRLKRILCLYRYKPNLHSIGYVDQISGYAGGLVRPEWFDALFFDIPEIMWTVDDPWISGHLERVGVPIWMNAQRRVPMNSGEVGKIDALLALMETGHDRVDADLLVIDYFRRVYGIWARRGPIDRNIEHLTKSMRELARRSLAAIEDDRHARPSILANSSPPGTPESA